MNSYCLGKKKRNDICVVLAHSFRNEQVVGEALNLTRDELSREETKL